MGKNGVRNFLYRVTTVLSANLYLPLITDWPYWKSSVADEFKKDIFSKSGESTLFIGQGFEGIKDRVHYAENVQSFYPLTKASKLLEFPNTGSELPMIPELQEFLDKFQTVIMLFWLAKEDEVNYL